MTRPDVMALVRHAVTVVCQVDPEGLGPQTTLDSLGADSLVRVGLADVVESDLASASGLVVRVDDAELGRVRTLGELAERVSERLTT